MTLIVLILVLGGLMHAASSFSDASLENSSGTTLAFGYLLLTAFFVGTIFKRIRLPKLTGYLVTGIVVGPNVLGLVPQPAVENLSIFTGVAVALIALTAGTEIELREMRPLLRSVAWVSLIAIGGTILLLAVAVFALRSLLPFMESMSLMQAMATCVVLGVVIVAQSPAVVVALRNELDADGPISRTVLAIVVIGDLLVILLFAAASTLAKATFGDGANVSDTARQLVWELAGSLAAGVIIGAVLAAYLRKVNEAGGLFVLAASFVVAEVGTLLHFDPLLIALAAGVFVRNVARVGDRLHDAIEQSSLPVYVVFFAVAGASIHLDVLLVVGIPAVALVVVRAIGLLAGARVGAKLARAPESVVRYAGYGLLSQAGLALALALLFKKTFPEFGEGAGALTLGIVAINEVLAPAVYRFALVRSGEAGQRDTVPSSAASREEPA